LIARETEHRGETIMTFRLSRRRFLAAASATGAGVLGNIATPYLSRAADRPMIAHGVQSGDVTADGSVIRARARNEFTKSQTTHCFLRISDYIAPQRRCPANRSGGGGLW